MEKPTNQEFYAANYMNQFRCITEACGKDHCCQGWMINVDAEGYKRIKKIMEKTAEGREQFKQRFKKVRSGKRNAGNVALMVLDPQTSLCSFLDERGYCSIHSKYGEDYLCNICRTYPRKLNSFPDRLELTAHLSCPEVGRLCLFEENSTEMVPVDPSKFSLKGLAPSNQQKNLRSQYGNYVHDLRSIMHQFLSLTDFPIASRLFFISYLAKQTEPFYRRGGQFTEQQLADEIDRIATPEMVNELHGGYQNLIAEYQIPIRLLGAIFHATGTRALPIDFSKWILPSYGLGEPSADKTVAEISFCIDAIVPTYKKRNQGIRRVFGERIDLVLTNFCKHSLYVYPYTDRDNLLLAVQGLLARLTTVSFFLFSHPSLDPFIEADLDSIDQAAAEKVFDSVVLEVFYKFSRALEHDPGLWERVFSESLSSNMATFAVLSQLLKFIEAK